MTNKKITEVLNKYEEFINDYMKTHMLTIKFSESCNHILEMIPKMRIFLQQNKQEKINRWLGFIQGFMWSNGFFTIDEMRNHNKEEELEPITVNGRTYPKEIMEEAVNKNIDYEYTWLEVEHTEKNIIYTMSGTNRSTSIGYNLSTKKIFDELINEGWEAAGENWLIERPHHTRYIFRKVKK